MLQFIMCRFSFVVDVTEVRILFLKVSTEMKDFFPSQHVVIINHFNDHTVHLCCFVESTFVLTTLSCCRLLGAASCFGDTFGGATCREGLGPGAARLAVVLLLRLLPKSSWAGQ